MQEALKKYFKLIQERVFLKKKNQKKGLSFLKKKKRRFCRKKPGSNSEPRSCTAYQKQEKILHPDKGIRKNKNGLQDRGKHKSNPSNPYPTHVSQYTGAQSTIFSKRKRGKKPENSVKTKKGPVH